MVSGSIVTEASQEQAGAVASAPAPVTVENLSVVHEPERPLLRVTFLIRKEETEPENISGHAFVALKQENDTDGDSWVLIPPKSVILSAPTKNMCLIWGMPLRPSSLKWGSVDL